MISVLPARGFLIGIHAFAALNIVAALMPPVSAATRDPLPLGLYIAALALLTLIGPRVVRSRHGWIVGPAAAVLTSSMPLLDSAISGATATEPRSWCVGAVTSLAALLAWSGRRVLAGVVWIPLVCVALIAGGVPALFSTGIVALLTAFLVGVLLVRMLAAADEEARLIAARHHAEAVRLAAAEAHQRERFTRMADAGALAWPLLQRIIDSDGDLVAEDRFECRILEQTLRDEIRGRRLLNPKVRAAVRRARVRGAQVKLMDEGTLEDLDPRRRDAVLDELADHIASVSSSRIVARTGSDGSDVAVTFIATTADDTAAALGLDGEERVDRWISISRA